MLVKLFIEHSIENAPTRLAFSYCIGVLDKTAKISQFYLTKVCVANFFINNNFSFHCEVVKKVKSEIEISSLTFFMGEKNDSI